MSDSSSDSSFDVIVVGASLAGCASAALLAQQGWRVALLERHAKPEVYKHLCTHFIQASALPALRALGLDRLIEQAGGIRNGAEFHTPHGWVGADLGPAPDGSALHGYSIRRSKLDPMVRRLAEGTPGVSLMAGWTVRGLVREGGQAGARICGVKAWHEGQEVTLSARLVVAADGRASEMARVAGIPARTSGNTRHGVAVTLRGVDLQRGELSQMWMTGPEVAYVFPNDDGTTVLAWVAPKATLQGRSRAQLWDDLLARIRSLPEGPQLRQVEPVHELMVARDYPCQWRPPVSQGMALVGDAATSLDYIHGVGCGWAFQSAQWLAQALGAAPKEGHAVDVHALDLALKAYASQHERALAGHRFFINDFARRRHFNAFERLFFAAAAKDAAFARRMGRVGARIDSPVGLLSPAVLARAVWINLRHGKATPQGTRQALPAPQARTSDRQVA